LKIDIVVVGLLVTALAACGAEDTQPVQEPLPTATQAPESPAEQEQPSATPDAAPQSDEETERPMSFELGSESFDAEQAIPSRFSCDGENISPPLSWSGAPEGTQSYALIFDDPDAPGGTWVHWVLFNIPADSVGLPEALPPDPALSDGSLHGSNSWGSIGYGGPCPPGGTHRYFFKLYALDRLLELDEGSSKEQLLAAIEGHSLGETQLMGTYTR
jgi:Raf kinase inhibitor-like YbhB/YbcL family protein